MAEGEDEKRMCLSSTRLLQIGGDGDFAGEQVVHQAGFLFLEVWLVEAIPSPILRRSHRSVS